MTSARGAPALARRILAASRSAEGTVVILSANPMHDTGGGQRSAQMALEFLTREWCVVFVSHGEVTETVDLELHFEDPSLVECSLAGFLGAYGDPAVAEALRAASLVVITQVPLPEWRPVLRWAERLGGITVYDCIDNWDSELGFGWYRGRIEKQVAATSALRTASAPALVHHVESLTRRPVESLPNAYNARIFQAGDAAPRPRDLPEADVVLYVGALWGGWMDWALVSRIAEEFPHVALTFIGDHRGEGGDLPSNCHFLGLKAQRDLPPYLIHARAAFLPWKSDDVTRATSPLKVYEFLAMDLPVVAPRLEPLYGIPGVVGAPDTASFLAALKRLTSEPIDASTVEAMREFAADNSWERRIDDLMGWIEQRPPAVRPGILHKFGHWLSG